MFPITVGILLGLAIGAFGYSCFRWFKIISSGQPDPRFNDYKQRLKNVLVIAFGQTKILRRDFKAGLMHAIIFWGFLVIALRTILLFGMGFDQSFGQWFIPSLPGHLYTLLLNLFEFLVLLAAFYGLYRRLVVKPKRLTLSAEGIKILNMIALLMISDFIFDGSRLVFENMAAAQWAPVSSIFANIFKFISLSEGRLRVLGAGAYLTHIS